MLYRVLALSAGVPAKCLLEQGLARASDVTSQPPSSAHLRVCPPAPQTTGPKRLLTLPAYFTVLLLTPHFFFRAMTPQSLPLLLPPPSPTSVETPIFGESTKAAGVFPHVKKVKSKARRKGNNCDHFWNWPRISPAFLSFCNIARGGCVLDQTILCAQNGARCQ